MLKRLGKEVQTLSQGDLSGIGIHVWFDETNIKWGKAMLIGPEGTPYAHCPLVFSIRIPNEYPLDPPVVTIDTSDGITRFHPNLYTSGKVCLSILGTYVGPSWATTMTIETVLKSIYSLLNENPITNEPGYETRTLAEPIAKDFAEWVQYALVKHTVAEFNRFQMGAEAMSIWEPFRDIIETYWLKTHWSALSEIIQERASKGEKMYANIAYGMSGRTNWAGLAAASEKLSI